VVRARVYADATALIGLSRIDRLDLLRLLDAPILVTEHVWSEVFDDLSRPGIRALQVAVTAGLLVLVDEGVPDEFPQLDAGEASVLSAAVATRAVVIIDERAARLLIERDPEVRARLGSVTGSLGLILLAKRRGVIQAVRPVLDELIAQGFRISADLYRDVLVQAGETGT